MRGRPRSAARGGGLLLASGGNDATVRLWDLAAGGAEVAVLRAHTGAVAVLAAFPDGRLASGCCEGDVCVWEAAKVTKRLPHPARVRALAVLDGDLFACSSGREVYLHTMAPLADAQVRAVEAAISRGAPMYNAGDVAGCAALYLEVARAAAASGALPAPSQRKLAALVESPPADADERAWAFRRAFDRLCEDAKCGAALKGHTATVSALAALPSGLLASGSFDKSLRLWDVGARACVAVIEGFSGALLALAALPGGRLAAAAVDDALVGVWALCVPGSPEDAAAAAEQRLRIIVAPA